MAFPVCIRGLWSADHWMILSALLLLVIFSVMLIAVVCLPQVVGGAQLSALERFRNIKIIRDIPTLSRACMRGSASSINNYQRRIISEKKSVNKLPTLFFGQTTKRPPAPGITLTTAPVPYARDKESMSFGIYPHTILSDSFVTFGTFGTNFHFSCKNL